MWSSRITTLFAEPPPSKRGPSSVAVSILLHSVALVVWLYFGLRQVPRINDRPLVRHFTVRLLKQDSIQEPRKKFAAGTAAMRPSQSSASKDVAAGGQPAPLPSLAAQLDAVRNHTQTLIQPDVPPDVALLQEVPVPTVVRWAPVDIPDKAIVLPLPKVLTAGDIRASVTPPNHELVPDQVKISSTRFSTQLPALPPSTTSPISVRGPEPIQEIPESASQSLIEPTPAQVISLSDLSLKQGSVTIPAANAASKAAMSEPLVPGASANGSHNGNGNPGTVPNGSGSGQKAASTSGKLRGGGGTVTQIVGEAGTSPASATGAGNGDGPSTTHISLPRDGQFGVVVVGSSLAEQYPDLVNIWGSRLVYTVYLHVGLDKNWILQYSLPRAADAAATESMTRPDAPWPYDITRPNLSPDDYNSDAIMVHGFVNMAGRFEKLAIAFPAQFAQTKFVLDALQRWQFRPARQNGQLTPVEVLLIIPEIAE